MDILKANSTDKRLPERLRKQMNIWDFADLKEVLQFRFMTMVQLGIVERGKEMEFFLFLKEYKILHLLDV